MTTLFFVYSDIYNQTLFNLSGTDIPVETKKNLNGYPYKLHKHWSQYNKSFFEYYAQFDFVLPEIWNVYLVDQTLPIIPFSHPLTIKMNGIENNIGVIFHEMIHVFLYFNTMLHKDITYLYSPLKEEFPEASSDLLDHLVVNAFTRGGMYQILGEEKTKFYIATQKNWQVGEVAKAWEVIEKKSFDITTSPLETLRNLCDK